MTDWNAESRAAWEANAAYWDSRMGEGNDFVNILIWPATERLLAPTAGERLLEIACGNGLHARRLAALGLDVVATDFSAAMLEAARARPIPQGGSIEYRHVDATDDTALRALGEGRFDAVLCQMALFDMAEIDPLMRAIPHLLRPDGRFVFSVMHPCFNSAHVVHTADFEDREGELLTTYAIKVPHYKSPSIRRGLALAGQPETQPYFHRPLEILLGSVFRAGMVIDGIEEPAFPPDHPPGSAPLHWSGRFSEIPPVLVARARATPPASG